MILRLILQNFLSFDSAQQFDMFPNMKRTLLQEHVYYDREVPLLKQSAIYGANASGKSNLVKGVEFLKAFATDRNFLKNVELDNFSFRLNENSTGKPIRLAVEFEYNGHYYFYEVEIELNSVRRECLSETFPSKGERVMVYERRNCSITFGESIDVGEAVLRATESLLGKNVTSSLLSLNREFPIIQDERCSDAFIWFDSRLEVIGIHSELPLLIDMLRQDRPMMEFVNELVCRLEVGVDRLTLSNEDFDSWAKQHVKIASALPDNWEKVQNLTLNANNAPILSIGMEDGVKKVYRLIFNNVGRNGFTAGLDTSAQSDGTLRALRLLPALYYASRLGKTIVVDEINFCLTPTMVRGLVEFFAKSNDTNGQLIFTIHDTQLLDARDVLRSDEVWFVDKQDGASVIYSHNDFKEHHTMSIMKGYNEGRFGAIRYVSLLESVE